MTRKFYRHFCLLLNRKARLFVFSSAFIFVSCSKTPIDYGALGHIVISSSQENRPAWIGHPQKEMEGTDRLFFSYETTPKSNKEIACTISRSFIKQDLTELVADFYFNKGESKEWSDLLDENMKEQISNFFKSGRLEKSYWEVRQYPFEREEAESRKLTSFFLAT